MIEQDKKWAGERYLNYDLIFCAKDSSPLDPRVFTRMFEKLLIEAGLLKTTFHSLRHTAGLLILESTNSLNYPKELKERVLREAG
ncbi:tyrosine-type recombinase/integrase [Heliobacterium undosum]|uniref:Tyrosine-type recombinase/integrase n=1 Tax=Heliomicrobium undosum TaxID=121734 RepID=A0A845L4G8_9FIRM|nr:tyrosine-type recombinase/integrase [Heliomicrobium undosum]MZP28648.1 tyrosine-type recombinase/integrase [Heliomicrobium undosum]